MTNADYQVTITMNQDTLTTLWNSGYFLYGFRAVQSSDKAGRPLVWFKTQKISETTPVSWSEVYYAYTSTNDIIPNRQIDVGFSATITLNQTLNVGVGGVGDVTNEGTPTAFSIFNTTSTQFTCGISEMQNGVANPLCAFPLYGNILQTIAPTRKILLIFSTDSVTTGTVIEQFPSSSIPEANTPAILVDLTGASQNSRQVNFDINKGWNWDNAPWGQQVAASADLVPLLIDSSASDTLADKQHAAALC